jgi:succinate dehydrogenase/fumarate reductase cytochrome b subunit
MSNAVLPRNTTRQAESILYGDLARRLHRVSGVVIIVFVLVHVLVQAVRHVPMFAPINAATPWLQALQEQNWVHAILVFFIAFHTLYGIKLLVGELGFVLHYKTAFWVISIVSTLLGLREVLRYAGI